MSEENGIVTLEELPEKEIYLELEPKFIKMIKEKVKEKSNLTNFSNELNISERILDHWFNDGSLIRLDVFKKILKYFKINSEKVKILSLRGKGGKKIKNPKLPFDFTTSSGVRVIAAMLGDGSLNKRGVFYLNSKNELIRGFIDDINKVFGNIEFIIRFQRKKNSILKRVELPKFCEKIFEKVGISTGPKVITNPSVPRFIFNLSKKKIAEFIAQIIDDEGSVSIASRHIRIKFSVSKNEKILNLIEDAKKLLLKLDIESSIYQIGEYNSTKGGPRKNWQIEIHSFHQLKKLYSILNLRNKERKEKLKKLINSKRIDQFSKKKCTSIYLKLMKEVQQQKGYFTSFDLSKKSRRSIGTCRNLIAKFKKLGFIKCVEPHFTGREYKPAKYVVK